VSATTVKKVYIQLGDDGMPVAPCGYALWDGARFLGLNPEGFRLHPTETTMGYRVSLDAAVPRLLNGTSLDASTLVHGWVKTVHTALKQIGVPIPPPLDYPEELFGFLGREIRKTTLGEVHKAFAANDRPVFIKPVAHKMFTGHTIERFRDLAETSNVDKEMPVWASGLVDFVSEYRCFVHEGALLGIHRYYGDNWVLPDKATVIQMIKAYQGSPSVPIAYGLDVGVTREGKTLLVELNDWHSLGHYGLPSLQYTEATIARWEQMCQC
jgi:hypothetical protein